MGARSMTPPSPNTWPPASNIPGPTESAQVRAVTAIIPLTHGQSIPSMDAWSGPPALVRDVIMAIEDIADRIASEMKDVVGEQPMRVLYWVLYFVVVVGGLAWVGTQILTFLGSAGGGVNVPEVVIRIAVFLFLFGVAGEIYVRIRVGRLIKPIIGKAVAGLQREMDRLENTREDARREFEEMKRQDEERLRDFMHQLEGRTIRFTDDDVPDDAPPYGGQ